MAEPQRAGDWAPYGRSWEDGGAADWAARNPTDRRAANEEHVGPFGWTRTTMYGWFLRDIPKTASILEVGANKGVQLQILSELGFTNLAGCDISADVVAQCPFPAKVGDARALPYDDNSFDIVLTSGTLMAVPFDDKLVALAEFMRVTRRYILGFEQQTYVPTQKTYDRMPPAYLLPIERLLRLAAPNAVMLRSDTWRAPTDSTYLYLLDIMPLQPETG